MDTLLDRFCRYVKVETTAVEDTTDAPSSPGQWDLGKMLAEEMKALKLEDVSISEHNIVMGTIPGNVPGAPTIAWLAHQDTSPEASGKNVKPTLHKNYDGKDIVLPGDPSKVIKVAETTGLAELKGKTVITSDGTTLLGADDKAGIAVILTTAAHLMANPDIKHGPIRVVFTVDEEVGRGTDKVDIKKINATCAYTLDGEAAGGLENETFSADMATVTITGVNIHPGLAHGKMVNAIRLMGEFLEKLPKKVSPECTKDREQFMHPYVLEGGVPETKVRILLRSFVTDDLTAQAELIKKAASEVQEKYPKAKITVEVKKQYRNMIEHLETEPRAVKLAAEAYRKIGIDPVFEAIRGGTDGSRLSEMGLPTPNISCGMHNLPLAAGVCVPGADGNVGEDADRAGPVVGSGEVARGTANYRRITHRPGPAVADPGGVFGVKARPMSAGGLRFAPAGRIEFDTAFGRCRIAGLGSQTTRVFCSDWGRSSIGLERRPVTPEVAGSSPVGLVSQSQGGGTTRGCFRCYQSGPGSPAPAGCCGRLTRLARMRGRSRIPITTQMA